MNHRDTEDTEKAAWDAGKYPDQELTKEIIGAAIEVHRALGPGLLESAYEACICRELSLRNITFTTQVPLPVIYKDFVWTADIELTCWLKAESWRS